MALAEDQHRVGDLGWGGEHEWVPHRRSRVHGRIIPLPGCTRADRPELAPCPGTNRATCGKRARQREVTPIIAAGAAGRSGAIGKVAR